MAWNLAVAESSGELAADTAVRAEPAILFGATLVGGSGAATLKIYDDVDSADGTMLLTATAAAGATANIRITPVAARYGLYADVNGAGAKFIVYSAKSSTQG